jgi:hypothetical protein
MGAGAFRSSGLSGRDGGREMRLHHHYGLPSMPNVLWWLVLCAIFWDGVARLAGWW